MPQLNEFIRQLAPKMIEWRRDFHLHAESGWLEFRTASKVAEILDALGYQLALGRDVIDADSRMGLPDEETLAQAFQRARAQGAPERWLPAFEGGFAGVVATLDTGRPGRLWRFASIWMRSISTSSTTIIIVRIAIVLPPATKA